VAFSLRERMSADNWRTLNQLTADPVFQRGLSPGVGLPLALPVLDLLVRDAANPRSLAVFA
jgi:uncharacterized alpha-E superfamily protein